MLFIGSTGQNTYFARRAVSIQNTVWYLFAWLAHRPSKIPVQTFGRSIIITNIFFNAHHTKRAFLLSQVDNLV